MRPSRSARRRGRAAPQEATKPNLTPLIDITFQLVVFLLVAQDLAPKPDDDIELPVAVNAGDHSAPRTSPLLVRLAYVPDDRPPHIIVRGKAYGARHFRAMLADAAAARPRDDDGVSRLRLLLRADHRVTWRHVQWLM